MRSQQESKLLEEELLKFKSDIDIVEFALKHGYNIESQKDCKKYRALKKEEDVIIVSKLACGVSWYFNQYDLNDKGTIIDFVKTRLRLSLGEVRKTLRDHINSPIFIPSSTFKLSGRENPSKKVNLASYLDVQIQLTDPAYLLSRGITIKTLHNQAFCGKIFNHTVTDTESGKTFTNTAFPIFDQKGIISIELVNKGFKSILEDTLAGQGVWISGNTVGDRLNPLDSLVITESGIDALSHYQLHYRTGENVLYLATHGSVTEAQTVLIQKIIDKRRPANVVLAVDNDCAGSRYRINFLNTLRYPCQPEISETKNEFSCKFYAGQAGKNGCRITLHCKNYPKNFLSHLQQEIKALGSGVLTNNVLVEDTNAVQFHLEVRREVMPALEELLWPLKQQESPSYRKLSLLRHVPFNKDFNDDLQNFKTNQ